MEVDYIVVGKGILANRAAPGDYKAGPFESTTDACTKVPAKFRYIGLTVIINDGVNGAVEYWFKNGTTDEDLVLKTSSTPAVDLIDNHTTAASGQGALDAHQGKVLSDFIGNLSSLTTSDKSNIVAAINSLIVDSNLNYMKLTQAQYDAITTKDPNILYIIVG